MGKGMNGMVETKTEMTATIITDNTATASTETITMARVMVSGTTTTINRTNNILTFFGIHVGEQDWFKCPEKPMDKKINNQWKYHRNDRYRGHHNNRNNP